MPRSHYEIEQDLPYTWVCVQGGKVLATVSLIFFRQDLCEIRALAVHPEHQKKGLGQKVVQLAVDFLRQDYPYKPIHVFALTYIPAFFEKLGFRRTEKEKFPDKIYEVCQFCQRRHDCQELAVELWIS